MHSGYPSINHRLTEPTWQGPDEEAAERRVVCVVLNIGEERAIVLGVRYGDIRRSSGQLCCGLNKTRLSDAVFSLQPVPPRVAPRARTLIMRTPPQPVRKRSFALAPPKP